MMSHCKDIAMKIRYFRFSTLLLIGMMTMLLNGCTRNNGDIGKWFGRWQVTEIAVDGIPDKEYDGHFFFSFQNDILGVIWLAPEGYDRETYTSYGTWKEISENALEFDFNHDDDTDLDIYRPFAGLHFPSDAPFTLSVTAASGNECTLNYTSAADGITYSYRLKKS